MNADKYIVKCEIFEIMNKFVSSDYQKLYVTKDKNVTNDLLNDNIVKFDSYEEAKKFKNDNYQEILNSIRSLFSVNDFVYIVKEYMIDIEEKAKREFVVRKLSDLSIQQLIDIYNEICINTNKLQKVIVNIENATDNSVLENVELKSNHKYVVLNTRYDVLVPYTEIGIALYVITSDFVVDYINCHLDCYKQYFE